jgi:hypothetical protein
MPAFTVLAWFAATRSSASGAPPENAPKDGVEAGVRNNQTGIRAGYRELSYQAAKVADRRSHAKAADNAGDGSSRRRLAVVSRNDRSSRLAANARRFLTGTFHEPCPDLLTEICALGRRIHHRVQEQFSISRRRAIVLA